jgi:transposase
VKKTDREIVEILVAFDATESVYAAAKMTGCDPKTVRRYVTARNAGRPVNGSAPRARLADPYAAKIEEWLERSQGHISATRAHQRLVRMGFTGSERTTRRMVAEARARWRGGAFRAGHVWTTEPGLWLQFGWAGGPIAPGQDGVPRRTVLFSAWLAWSRFRVVIPCRDRTPPTLVRCLDAAFRVFGGAPTYVLSRHAAGAGERHPLLLAAARHYGVQLRTCVPCTGEAAPGDVPLAASDLLPTGVRLPPRWPSFATLQDLCHEVTARLNEGAPRDRLAAERASLHPLPPAPLTTVVTTGTPMRRSVVRQA